MGDWGGGGGDAGEVCADGELCRCRLSLDGPSGLVDLDEDDVRSRSYVMAWNWRFALVD